MATTLLIECRCDASALALQRVCFEAVVRSLWLYELATPKWTDDPEKAKERQNYVENAGRDKFPKIYRMLEGMETSSILNIFKEKYLDEWNSYTHGGIKQLSGLLSEEGLSVAYGDTEMKQALTFSDLCFIVSSVFTARLAGNMALAETYVRRFIQNNKWLYEWTK